MKKFTLLFFAVFVLLGIQQVAAQQKELPPAPHRCGTMEMIEQQLRTDPEFRARWEQGQLDYQRSLQMVGQRNSSTARTSTLPDSVIIPVVVHIVLPNPNIITDADVEYFLNRLNLDFSGLNPDSANGTPFYSVRGHSRMRFRLARRDPSGNFTTGIERKVGNVLIGGGEPQAIKNAALGGLASWDHTQYYNVWVGGASGGLLGIAPAIGVGTATSDGVCVNYQAFANSSCYTIPAFNLARTAVHEIGHNFGLFHTFQGGCNTVNDFGQLTSASCQLPDSLLAPSDDTPSQSGATGGCPTGTISAGCASSPNPPGLMYQNYMDYTDDACYSMFTKGQVERMEWLLEFCRPGYLTTQGHLPPASMLTLDARAFEGVNPGGYEIVACNPVTYPSTLSCGGNFSPKFRVRNEGANTINTIRAGYILNGGAPVLGASAFTVNLRTAQSAVLTLPALVGAPGLNTIKFFTYEPNGAADQSVANDTLTVTFTVSGGQALPVSESFTSTTFPPANWTVVNPNAGSITWSRWTGTLPTGTPFSAPASAFFDIYSYGSTGHRDYLWSPPVQFTSPTDSVIVTFQVAHRSYSTVNDTLELVYSSDCGVTWRRLVNYYKWSNGAGANALATVTPSCFCDFAPTAAQWRQERIAFRPADLVGAPTAMMIGWKGTNMFGNNIFVDDINIETKLARDLRVNSIVVPASDVCTPTFTPQVSVLNSGTEDVTEFDVYYSIDALPEQGPFHFTQTIAAGASAVVTLPVANAAVGNHTFRARTANPVSSSGTGDQSPGNDLLTKAFLVNAVFNAPVSQGFELAAFPPANWQLINVDGGNTWVRRTPGNNSAGAMFIDNYNFNQVGQVDELRSPAINIAGADSVVFSFDHAHKNFDNFLVDTVTILMSTDCGVTYTPIWKRYGPTLATAGASTAAYVTPLPSDWRTNRVSVFGPFTGTVIFKVRNMNGYGNNVFIDNINIEAKYKRDAAVAAINQPTAVICTPNLTPSIVVENRGTETLTGVTLNYSIDGGATISKVFTGLSVAPGASTTLTLDAATVTGGNHSIRVWTSDPVTISGTGDQNTTNDEMSKTFALVATVAAPIVEGFENTAFPPAGWAVVNPDGAMTWARSSFARTGSGSAFMNNYDYTTMGARDDLYSPNMTYNGVDSVTLTFDVAAATKRYPGSTAVPLDTLTVLVSTNCGNSFTTVYQKWGEDLQTINDPNNSQTSEFFPSNADQWRSETINLSNFAPNGPIQVIFRSSSNFENNIFIDNVTVATKTLPARLKNDGYMLLPTPFQNQFTVWHYQTPSNLRSITVYNASGQLVWSQRYNGNAEKQITVDLSNRSAGVYIVNLGYEDSNRNVSTRVVKY